MSIDLSNLGRDVITRVLTGKVKLKFLEEEKLYYAWMRDLTIPQINCWLLGVLGCPDAKITIVPDSDTKIEYRVLVQSNKILCSLLRGFGLRFEGEYPYRRFLSIGPYYKHFRLDSIFSLVSDKMTVPGRIYEKSLRDLTTFVSFDMEDKLEEFAKDVWGKDFDFTIFSLGKNGLSPNPDYNCILQKSTDEEQTAFSYDDNKQLRVPPQTKIVIAERQNWKMFLPKKLEHLRIPFDFALQQSPDLKSKVPFHLRIKDYIVQTSDEYNFSASIEHMIDKSILLNAGFPNPHIAENLVYIPQVYNTRLPDFGFSKAIRLINDGVFSTDELVYKYSDIRNSLIGSGALNDSQKNCIDRITDIIKELCVNSGQGTPNDDQ